MGNRAHEHKGRVMGTWRTGVMGTCLMGHTAIIMHGSRWQTGVMGYMGDGVQGQWGTVNIFSEYVNIYLCDARGEFIVHIFA